MINSFEEFVNESYISVNEAEDFKKYDSSGKPMFWFAFWSYLNDNGPAKKKDVMTALGLKPTSNGGSLTKMRERGIINDAPGNMIVAMPEENWCMSGNRAKLQQMYIGMMKTELRDAEKDLSSMKENKPVKSDRFERMSVENLEKYIEDLRNVYDELCAHVGELEYCPISFSNHKYTFDKDYKGQEMPNWADYK